MNKTSPTVADGPSEVRRIILHLLKESPERTIAEIAAELATTYEAARHHIVHLEREGWIRGVVVRGAGTSAGRPRSRYTLTEAGEHLFPKGYDRLAIRLLDVVGAHLGAEALDRMLASITDAQVAQWEPLVAGRTLRERLELLKRLYSDDDSFMQVEEREDGLRLVERNCPYLNVAMKHSALCSTSVATLSRLLGVRVVREERFQRGDQRCVFRVLHDQPIDITLPRFEHEPEA